MVKIKKVICYLLLVVVLGVSSFSLVSCAKNEQKKYSKGLSTYSIQAKLSSDMKVSATENVTFVNRTGQALNEICFHLYPRAFREGASFKPYTSLTLASCFPNGISYGNIEISKVSVNEKQVNTNLSGEDEDILQIDLDSPLENKKSIKVSIDFSLIIPNATHRFGYYNGNINLGNWYPILCYFSDGKFDKSPYYSTGDPFCSEIANYDISISYPKEYNIFSTGEIETSEINGEIQAKITAKAVRDFALNFSNNSAKTETMVGGTRIVYVGYNSDENINKYLDISAKATEYFSKTFGNYPYSTLTIVKTPFIYGGMEYPNIVFISDSIDDEDEYLKVIVHEIAHQWWYAVVGNNEVTEAWLDESLAEYSTALFFENNSSYGISYDDLIKNAVASYTLYVDVIKTLRGEVNTKMNLRVNEYQNDYEYSYMVYVKGVIMFDELKNAVGEAKLINGLKKYYKDNKFKIASKQQFLNAFRFACHKDLDKFFEGFLTGESIISSLS